MTSNISGIPAASASTPKPSDPDALIELGIEFGLADAANRQRLERLAATAKVDEQAGEVIRLNPLRPADDHSNISLTVPCPVHAWCMGHEDGEEITPATLHYGEAWPAPAGTLYVHLDEGVPSVAFTPDSGETVYLDPDEAEAQAAALIEFAKAARSVTE